MDLAECRRKLVEGIDSILAHPLFLTRERTELLQATREVVESSDAVVELIHRHLPRDLRGVGP